VLRTAWQSDETILELLELLVDPVDRSPLRAVRAPAGELTELHGATAVYAIAEGIPQLIPPHDILRRLLDADRVDHWSDLQAAAEESYAVRVEGHFSIPSWQPAVDLAARLRELPGRRWLDAGCGRLPRPAYLVDVGDKQVFGIDPMAIGARREFPFVRALADRLPLRSAAFDGVVLPSSLDHAIDPAVALAEARRILRPGATLVVLETLRPDDERYRRWREASLRGPVLYNRHHYWAFTERELRVLVERAGFAIRTFEPTSDPTEAIIVASAPA
jgi:SAM-dependent methyltransferase